MRIVIRFFLSTLFGMCLAAPLWAQTCDKSSIAESTPTSRFDTVADDMVVDKETGITWMRCALGQKWDGNTCAGKADTYNWQEAMEIVAEMNKAAYGGRTDWRVPYVPELASIIERQCFNPRVNLAVFPATPLLAFWTGMEKMGRPDMAYILDFDKGNAAPSEKAFKGAVRLMHDGPNGPWWKMPQMR